MSTDEERFYSHIRHKALFDIAMKALAQRTLTDVTRILMKFDDQTGHDYDSRFMITYGSKIVTTNMINDMKESFADVDKYFETGELPDYMCEDPEAKELLNRLRDKFMK